MYTKAKQGVRHTVALPFTLKYLKGLHLGFHINIKVLKKNYGNSNISSCKNIIFKKSSEKYQNFKIL
jgi:hypothetical protein